MITLPAMLQYQNDTGMTLSIIRVAEPGFGLRGLESSAFAGWPVIRIETLFDISLIPIHSILIFVRLNQKLSDE